MESGATCIDCYLQYTFNETGFQAWTIFMTTPDGLVQSFPFSPERLEPVPGTVFKGLPILVKNISSGA